MSKNKMFGIVAISALLLVSADINIFGFDYYWNGMRIRRILPLLIIVTILIVSNNYRKNRQKDD